MGNEQVKSIVKSIVSGIILSVVFMGIAFLITKMSSRTFNDVLFFEGIFSILFGLFSAWGGNPIGLSMQSLGQNNSQYMANANGNVKLMEKEKTEKHIKNAISIGLSTVSLVLAGIILIVTIYI